MKLLLVHSLQTRHSFMLFSWSVNVWRGQVTHTGFDVALHLVSKYFPEKERALSFCTILHNHKRSLSFINDIYLKANNAVICCLHMTWKYLKNKKNKKSTQYHISDSKMYLENVSVFFKSMGFKPIILDPFDFRWLKHNETFFKISSVFCRRKNVILGTKQGKWWQNITLAFYMI